MILVPCKLLEHIVCSNAMAYLDECQLLSDRQYAFRKRHSCETQLTTIITKDSRLTHLFWTSRRLLAPPYELLKSKLFGYGIGRKSFWWIDSFLCYRTQRAVVNGKFSKWAPVFCCCFFVRCPTRDRFWSIIVLSVHY